MQPRIPYPQPALTAHQLGELRERAALVGDSELAHLIQRVEFLEWEREQKAAQR
jgi:hypothetical protein